MQARTIKDSQITSGGYVAESRFSTVHGRLYGSSGSGSWAAIVSDNMWIQVTYPEVRTIHGVVTQGRLDIVNGDQWVTTYQVMYQPINQDELVYVTDSYNQPEVFIANDDRETPVIGNFPNPITTSVIRIKPISYHRHPSMRFDTLIC